MGNDQQQMGEMSALSKIGSFITSIFNGAHATEVTPVVLVVDEGSSVPSVIIENVSLVNVLRTRDRYEKPQETPEEASIRIIAEAELTPDRFKPSSVYFTNWSQYKLIHTLYVRGEVSRRELGELVDIANVPDLVARMNRLGWSICCERRGSVDATGRCRYRGYYSLSESRRDWAWASLYSVQFGYV